MNSIRLLVADDQPAFRDGLVALLSALDGIEVVAEAENGADAVRRAHATHPDVVLMDLRMPTLDGVAATRQLRAELPSTRIVVLTTFDDDDSILDAIRAGAVGYLLKDTGAHDLQVAIRKAAEGESFLSASVVTRLVHRLSGASPPQSASSSAGRFGLTARELDVLGLISRGATNKDIARHLDLAEGTVKNHVSSVFAKLGVTDRLQAALAAREHGLV